MGFTRRYEASWIKMKELLDGGAVGSLQMILLSRSSYIAICKVGTAKLSGQAGLSAKCSHHFDVFRWMASSDCLSVSAFGGRSGVFKPNLWRRLGVPNASRMPLSPFRVLEENKETVSSVFVNTRNLTMNINRCLRIQSR